MKNLIKSSLQTALRTGFAITKVGVTMHMWVSFQHHLPIENTLYAGLTNNRYRDIHFTNVVTLQLKLIRNC